MFNPPLPPKSSHLIQAETDAADGTNFPVRATADRSPYLAVLQSAPLILESMDYENQPLDMRQAIWDAIDDYDVDGTINVTAPADFEATYDITNMSAPPNIIDGSHPITVDFTRTEALATYGAKFAHAVYHDANNSFPWKLNKYTLEDLEGLFNPKVIFSYSENVLWDLSSPTVAQNIWIIDYHPQNAYDRAVANLNGATTARQAFNALFRSLFVKLRHNLGFPSDMLDPGWYIKPGDVFYWPWNGDPGAGNNWVSRWGCHFACQLMAALSRSINIPAVHVFGVLDAGGHASIGFPSINRAWTHGDDIYQEGSTELHPKWKQADTYWMVPWDDWRDQVVEPFTSRVDGGPWITPFDAGQATGKDPAMLVAEKGYRLTKSTIHPHYATVNQMCGAGIGLGEKHHKSFWEHVFQDGDAGKEAEMQAAFKLVNECQQYTYGIDLVDTATTYGRIQIGNDHDPTNFDMQAPYSPDNPPENPGLNSTERILAVNSMNTTAKVGDYDINWRDDRDGYAPPSQTTFSVVADQTTVIPAPTYTRTAVEVNFQLPWTGAGYIITPDPLTGSGSYSDTGDGSLTIDFAQAVPGDYTIEWQDNLVGYNPPTPATEGPFTLATGNTISFGPPTYVAE